MLALVVVFLASGTARGAEPWTLERAIAFALTNSPNARIAGHRIALAQAGMRQANAGLWPQLQFNASYLGGDNPTLAFSSAMNQREFSPTMDFNNPSTTDNLNVRGTLSWYLYNGGQTSAGRAAARANAESARQTSEAVRSTLAFEVSRTFHTVVKAREFIRAAEAAVHSFETNLTIARKRLDAGTVLKTELLDVEVRLASAREDLVRSRNARTLSERALRNLLGIEGGEFSVDDTAPSVAPPPANAPSARPELLAAEQQTRVAEAQVRRAKGGYLPKVSAFSSYEYNHGWELNGSGESWMAGLALSMDLWDGQLTRGRVDGARAEFEAAREEERKLRLQIDFEVEQAQLNLKEASERLAVTEKTITMAAESVDLTRSRFEQGLALATQLIDAETALTAARVRRSEAQADQRIAIAALRRALGLSQLP